MAIYKANVQSEYAQIPNSTLQDKSLTFEAKGLLAMMLSLPENWEIHKSWLQDQAANCGRDKLTRLMKELQEAGYVRKQMKHREDGKFSEVDWYVFPTAQLESRSTAKPSDGKPATTKETVKQKKQVNKETSLAPSADGACSECLGLGYHGLPEDKCQHCNGTGKEPQPPAKPEKPKRKTKAEKLFDKLRSSGYLIAQASDDVLTEWCKLRVRKGASDSDLVHKRIDGQLQILINHGMTIDAALTEQVARNWTDLKAEWFDVMKGRLPNQQEWAQQTQPGWSAGLENEIYRGEK